MDALAPRPHFSPEYVAADNSAPLLYTCITFLVIETTFISLLYASRLIGGEVKKAKLSMLVLMTGCYFVCLCKITIGILAVKIGGAGRHMPTLTPTEFITSLQLNTALQIVCPLTTSLSKLSILCLLNDILSSTSVRYKVIIRCTFTFVTIVAIVQLIIPFGNCKPFEHSWNVFSPGTCAIDGLALWKYLSIPNVLTTIFIVGIPIPAIWRLKVTPSTKAGLVVVLMVCATGVVAAVMRFLAFLKVQNFKDFTYEEIGPLSWTIAESGIYMVAGVLPTLRQLGKKCYAGVDFDKLLSGTFGAKRRSGTFGKERRGRLVVVRGEGVDLSEDSGKEAWLH